MLFCLGGIELEWKLRIGIGLIVAGVIFYLLNFIGFLTYPPGPRNGTVWNVGYILFIIFFILGVTSIIVQWRDKSAYRRIAS